jgi:hypothetical protein
MGSSSENDPRTRNRHRFSEDVGQDRGWLHQPADHAVRSDANRQCQLNCVCGETQVKCGNALAVGQILPSLWGKRQILVRL